MESISILPHNSVGTLCFTASREPNTFAYNGQITVHVFELLQFGQCRLIWDGHLNEGEFVYPSEEWLTEKLQEILNGRS